MGNNYGDAAIDLLYDLDTEVRITNPSEEIRKIHGITPARYLVLPKTDKKFPEGVFIPMDDIRYEPKTIIRPPKQRSPYPSYERKELSKCNAGEIYPVTLIQRVIHVDSELERMGIPRTDDSNLLVFAQGDLEKRLSSAKEKFLAKLKVSGLAPDKAKIYYRLVCFTQLF